MQVLSVNLSCSCQEVDLKVGETLEPGKCRAFMFRGNSTSSGPSEGSVSVECRNEDGQIAKYSFRLKGVLPAIVESRPRRLALKYGESDILELVIHRKDLMSRFQRASSLFDLVTVEKIEGLDSGFAFCVKAVDDVGNKRMDAMDIIVIHFSTGSELERFSIPCSISTANSSNIKAVKK